MFSVVVPLPYPVPPWSCQREQTLFTAMILTPPPGSKPSKEYLAWLHSLTPESVISLDDPAVKRHLTELHDMWRAHDPEQDPVDDDWLRKAVLVLLDGNHRRAALLRWLAQMKGSNVKCIVLRAMSVSDMVTLVTGPCVDVLCFSVYHSPRALLQVYSSFFTL